MDWGSLAQELGQLIADGRDVLDATQFLTGTGTDSPAGVLTGLAVAQRVQTAGAGAIAVGDLYALKGALPARFIANATWAAHPNRLDSIFRLTPSGSTTEPQAMPERDGALIGKPVVEWSTMATAATTGTKWALYGDFRAGFTIADRIGMSIELIPHLFGASQRPTGQRGLFAYWRTGSKVVVPEALRYGEVL
jgi:HK97 family phage major capsid protein